MSSDNPGENPGHRKSKVSYATLIDVGSVGPKAKPKGAVDGQQVKIPAPRTSVSDVLDVRRTSRGDAES